MLKLMSIAVVVFVALVSGCFGADVGCIDDSQCRSGRFCVDGRCQGTMIAPVATNNDDPGDCEVDTECPSDSLCRDGVCDEYQCRNADGTDTSPDCECNTFAFTSVVDGCTYEQRCFSGNLLLECISRPSSGLVCTCYEALQPVSMAMAGEDFCSQMDDDAVYAACGWELP